MVSRSIRISTPRNPAATMTCCNWSASPKLNADRICAACSLPTLRSTASAIAACQGQCSIERQTLITVRPRSANTRCISETAAALLGMNCKPCWQMTQSKVASANGMSVALPTRHSIAAAVSREARARASMPALRSKPTTCPAEPILFAASRVTTPVPHATSSTRSPGLIAATSTSRRE